DADNVLYLIGQKFGTIRLEARTWAINAWLPGAVARRFATSRIVAWSSGNVYPLWPADGDGPSEIKPTGPVGEYAQSVLGRERIFEYFSDRQQTPMAFLRLNYAVEPRYGVLRDIADKVWGGEPVDLRMGYVNVIWQRDANAIALRALEHCAVPPLVLNVSGPKVSVRAVAEGFAERFGKAVMFSGEPAATALLSNAARCTATFGMPPVGIEEMLDRVAAWVAAGGRSLDKPTHFQERGGRF
ncbi:MAG: NAD-dependent epimerase/dehydratase family protein, partial [Gemmatimonadales bacterium]